MNEVIPLMICYSAKLVGKNDSKYLLQPSFFLYDIVYLVEFIQAIIFSKLSLLL